MGTTVLKGHSTPCAQVHQRIGLSPIPRRLKMHRLIQRASSLALVLALLVQIALLGTLALPSCTRYTMESSFVGGGFLSNDVFLTIHNYVSGSTRETRVRYRNVNTGAIIRSDVFPLGAIQAITCPSKSYYAISHIALAFGDGTNIVQPFIYYDNGAQLGYVFRTTYVLFDDVSESLTNLEPRAVRIGLGRCTSHLPAIPFWFDRMT